MQVELQEQRHPGEAEPLSLVPKSNKSKRLTQHLQNAPNPLFTLNPQPPSVQSRACSALMGPGWRGIILLLGVEVWSPRGWRELKASGMTDLKV